MIGHAGHPEVEGTMGRYDTQWGGRILLIETPEDVKNLEVADPTQLAFVSQTTLSVDDTHDIIEKLKERFPTIAAPRRDDICYATQNRQDAVKVLCEDADILLVVGAENSSNSNRLRELGERAGIPSYLISDASAIKAEWLENRTKIGVTAGASAPEELVQPVIDHLKACGASHVNEVEGAIETITFSIPKPLRRIDNPARDI